MGGIFDAIASSYLREDAHWGCDLDVLKNALDAAVKKSQHPRYVDLGCGLGFHISFLGNLYPEAAVVGVDSSLRMLEQARKRLDSPNAGNIALVHASISEFNDGEKYDVVSCMNNTLNNLYEHGVPPPELRKKVIRHARYLLRAGGHLILSVYNREKLDLADYGQRLFVLSESDVERGDLFVEYRTNDSIEKYYSHWSTDAELTELLEHNGFKLELLEKRMARFVVKARAT